MIQPAKLSIEQLGLLWHNLTLSTSGGSIKVEREMRVDSLERRSMSPTKPGKFDVRASLGVVFSVAVLGAFMIIPVALGAQQKAVKVLDNNEVEITCNASRDEWLSIIDMGPIDAAGEEAAISQEIKVTLKYLFIQGSKRQRVTLLVKWTHNATVSLEVNPKQLCDTKGTSGVRTTISGQTQVSDGKAALPPGYIRILPEDLD
jgi:hypothetical protein